MLSSSAQVILGYGSRRLGTSVGTKRVGSSVCARGPRPNVPSGPKKLSAHDQALIYHCIISPESHSTCGAFASHCRDSRSIFSSPIPTHHHHTAPRWLGDPQRHTLLLVNSLAYYCKRPLQECPAATRPCMPTNNNNGDCLSESITAN
jgi:hypothetical protein